MTDRSVPRTPAQPAWLAPIFVPILAGATLRDRMFACLGALLGIALTGWICSAFLGPGAHLPMIVAPLEASAVLLFAVPASPLAQPWPIIGGNMISALVGVAVARTISDPTVAIGLAVGLAIAAMSFTRSLHPPGGAAALTAVIGGSAVESAGFLFPFVPVALNSVLLVALGFGFHQLSRHAYPHKPAPPPANTHQTADPPPALRMGFRGEDVDAALATLNETFDIDRDDLDRVLREVENQALLRSQGDLASAEIMSRDVVGVDWDATPEQARALLLDHNIRTLPVTDGDGRLAGTVGLRELATPAQRIKDVLSPALTAAPEDPAFSLLSVLTDGRTHAVVVIDPERHILGMVTQTDLLAASALALRS